VNFKNSGFSSSPKNTFTYVPPTLVLDLDKTHYFLNKFKNNWNRLENFIVFPVKTSSPILEIFCMTSFFRSRVIHKKIHQNRWDGRDSHLAKIHALIDIPWNLSNWDDGTKILSQLWGLPQLARLVYHKQYTEWSCLVPITMFFQLDEIRQIFLYLNKQYLF